jgi:TRAP-type C4-dicarboxylate transport system permease small subunit
MMVRFERMVTVTSGWLNYAACLAVVVMMLLSCADVAMRLFGAPIPGAYEMVGFLGAVIVSFALAHTSLQRGHVAVELIFEKLPPRAQCFVDAAGNLIGAALFGLMAWQSLAYGTDLRQSGEVSLTLQMPVYPFVYGIALGSGILALVLLTDFIKSSRRGLIA